MSLNLRTRLLAALDAMLVAFDFIRIVSREVLALYAAPAIAPQQRRLTFGSVFVNGLAHTTTLAGDDQIPGVRFADR